MVLQRSLLVATLGLVVVGLSACTRNDTVVAETLVPPSNAAPSGTSQQKAPPVVVAPEPAPPHTDGPLPPAVPIVVAKDESSAPKLGSACIDASLCGTKNKVSVRAFAFHNFRKRPDEPCKLVSTIPIGVVVHDVPSACVAGDRLYVETSCMMCRMPQGTVVEAAISELTPQQIANLQKVAGFEKHGPLRTAAEWQSAVAEAAKSPEPAQLWRK
jgi:hypothetical protein